MPEVVYATNGTDEWNLVWAYCIECGHTWPVVYPKFIQPDPKCPNCSPATVRA